MMRQHEVVVDEIAGLKRRLEEFILTAERSNQWIHRHDIVTAHVHLYLRTEARGVPDSQNMAARAFTLADIQITEAYRGRGILHVTLAWLEQRRPLDGICVENVVNKRLAGFLERRGYTKIPWRLVDPGHYSWWRRNTPGASPI
ncbi:GNAT superfamily N-acetyltransferase [Inquilinus ginsengisoli]|uniref:GNAT superfamily N-acetyltransferase n=1 Tax=Inquilinus ginsengisoli TaxID=363840 RepID=A0ABU1JTD6_9PROT|nr:hypothetical protein [Inquilinus ginsengisoli]MDR6290850.1 GNAT superfamily N-acetyltransferase [Inquilinus ginsengisoli]